MNFENDKHHRRSIRLRGYDYTQDGAYFVTICAARKKPVFGRIQNGAMNLNDYGKIVETCWRDLPQHFANVILDEHAIMPNHFHGILIINGSRHVGAQHAVPLRNVAPGSLGAIVRAFKSAATRHINAHRTERNLAPVIV